MLLQLFHVLFLLLRIFCPDFNSVNQVIAEVAALFL